MPFKPSHRSKMVLEGLPYVTEIMRKTKGDIMAFERVGRMVTRMDISQKRLVFGLAFQGWEIGDWIELIQDLPSGWEFAA